MEIGRKRPVRGVGRGGGGNTNIDSSSALINRKLVGVREGDMRAKAMRCRRAHPDKMKTDQALRLTNAVYLD